MIWWRELAFRQMLASKTMNSWLIDHQIDPNILLCRTVSGSIKVDISEMFGDHWSVNLIWLFGAGRQEGSYISVLHIVAQCASCYIRYYELCAKKVIHPIPVWNYTMFSFVCVEGENVDMGKFLFNPFKGEGAGWNRSQILKIFLSQLPWSNFQELR